MINDSIGTARYLDRKYSKPLSGQVYIKCDDPGARSSLKDSDFCEELKEYMPITAITKTFPCMVNQFYWVQAVSHYPWSCNNYSQITGK